ncbi:MAG TPA: glycoside hydrolase family 25 protein [Gemmataceae bacterium]|nr:glycoside hydrolase family 25 protein [Gemmataceae bacterium]
MTLTGIDISAFNRVDWSALAAPGGPAFAFAKATEGVGFQDQSLAVNGPALADPGPIVAGFYHFARPDLGNSAQAEADWFCRVVAPYVTACRRQPTGVLLALDLEVGSGQLLSWRDAFCDRVLANLGLPCGWYSDWTFVQEHGLDVPTDLWGWFAWPDSNGALPPAAFPIAIQQYGTGLQGGATCDLDRFFGDHDQLLALASGAGGDSMAISHSGQLGLVELAYFATLGRGAAAQTEIDDRANGIEPDLSGLWEITQALLQSTEGQAFMAKGTPAQRLAALEAAVAALEGGSNPGPTPAAESEVQALTQRVATLEQDLARIKADIQ